MNHSFTCFEFPNTTKLFNVIIDIQCRNVGKACDGECPCKPKGYRTPWKPAKPDCSYGKCNGPKGYKPKGH